MHPVLFKAKNWLERLNPVNVFANTPLTSYSKSRNWIELTRDSDGATLDVGYSNASKASALSWSVGTDSYISKRYSQVRGKPDITISNSSLQELAIAGNAWVLGTTKYALYEPFSSSISVNNNVQSINSRMKNKALSEYIILKNNVDGVVTSRGYTPDYCSFIKCSTGLMDFNVTNGTNVMWYLADGTVSTLSRPAKSMSAGVSLMFTTNLTIDLRDEATNANYVGDLKDINKFKGLKIVVFENTTNGTGNLSSLSFDGLLSLNLISFINLRGDLSSFINKAIYSPVLSNCPLITGDLSSFMNITYNTFSVGGCPLITGNLNNFSHDITSFYLTGCVLISGIFTPLTVPPLISVFTDSGMTTYDIDNTLIAYANSGIRNNGTFTATGKNRTVLSDTAVALLISRGWTINGITRI